MRKSCDNCKYGDEAETPCEMCIAGSRYEAKPITNADRIRAMKDEELSRFLEGVKLYFVNPTDIKLCKNCLHGDCCDCWLDWLRSPVEVDNG